MKHLEKQKEYKNKTFEGIKHIDEYGNEYWEARAVATSIRI